MKAAKNRGKMPKYTQRDKRATLIQNQQGLHFLLPCLRTTGKGKARSNLREINIVRAKLKFLAFASKDIKIYDTSCLTTLLLTT